MFNSSRILKIHKDAPRELFPHLNRWHFSSYIAIFYEEDIYIENIDIPRVKKKILEKIVKNQVVYRFLNVENINYSYEIVSMDKNNIGLRMYCINTGKNSFLSQVNKSIRVSRVFLIQFCYISYFSRIVKENAYKLVYSIGRFIYVNEVCGGSLIYNTIFECKDVTDNGVDIYGALELKNQDVLYVVNMDSQLKALFSEHKKIIDLGLVDEEKIIKSYIGAVI